MRTDHEIADVIVVGGGPSGTAVGSLLASWGHDVLLLTQPIDPRRGLANSIPPSARKILSAVDMFDVVDRTAYRTAGNTVWWGERQGRVESFDDSGNEFGYQVLRSALDPLLRVRAVQAGVRLRADVTVHRVHFETERARVVYRSRNGLSTTALAPLVLDCSGRTGVVGRREGIRLAPDCQMQALIGVWDRSQWELPDITHTTVETYDDGWAWAIPVSSSVRHVATMIDGATTRMRRGATLEATYRSELSKAPQTVQRLAGASLQHVWACDASVYASRECAGPGFLLVGDAGTTLDPLSSFGVKKALASAWIAAIAAHTTLRHRERRDAAFDFFSRWERRVYLSHLRRSAGFAKEACLRHPSAFWSSRAEAPLPAQDGDEDSTLLSDRLVLTALERLRGAASLNLTRNHAVPFVDAPLIRDREIVLEEAIAIPGHQARRYLQGVDLVALASLAPAYRQLPDLFDAYCTERRQVTLPGVLGGLSVLVAARVLHSPAATA